MSTIRPREIVSNLTQGLVFLIGAVGVALTVWLWGKRHSERSEPDTKHPADDRDADTGN
jgi:hypothetical protein